MTTAVLAVQGAFAEHAAILRRLGEPIVELRQARDLDRPFDRLVLPGGESTVQAKLLAEQGMLEPLRQRIAAGMPVLATCAGLILLAEELEGGDPPRERRLATFPMRVRRNAYGRQLGSFRAEVGFDFGEGGGLDGPDGFDEGGGSVGLGGSGGSGGPSWPGGFGGPDGSGGPSWPGGPDGRRTIPATFIRAPQIVSLGKDARPLAEHDGVIVAARYGNQLVCAFHPELDESTAIHELLLGL